LRHPGLFRAGTAVIAAAAVSVAMATSSSASSSSPTASAAAAAGVAYAKAQIAKATALPRFTLKAPKFSMAKIKGKIIFNIPVSSTVPYVVSVDQAAAKLTQSFGAKWVEYTNQGTPTQWTAGISQAIAQHANVIILAQGMAVQLVIPALQKAKAAGIPVVVTHDFQNGQTNTPPPTGPGANVLPYIKAFVNVPFWKAAQLEADYVIAQTNGKADDLIFTSPDVPPSNGITAAMVKEFKTYCTACKTTVNDVPLADWATKIAPETQSNIGSDPNLNWVTPIYDSMSLFAQQGITAAGKVGKVHIASYNGTPAVMKLIQGGNIMSMDVGENITWLAYASMDQIGRVLTGAPIIANGNEQTPLRVFTKSNINQAGTPPTPDLGYGTAYITGYHALWGVK
jgi:ribose transport system substrate-binding protein